MSRLVTVQPISIPRRKDHHYCAHCNHPQVHHKEYKLVKKSSKLCQVAGCECKMVFEDARDDGHLRLLMDLLTDSVDLDFT